MRRIMLDALRDKLARANQVHLLDHWTSLSPDQQQHLAKQIEAVDWSQLPQCQPGESSATQWQDAAQWKEAAYRAQPPSAIRLNDPQPLVDPKQAKEAGEAALRAGRLGVILVAGGQGTRLGFDLPKGMFELGPISNRSLFAMHVDRLRAIARRYRTSIPLYLMTSPATDEATRNYFAENRNFGLAEEDLIIFCQGTMPAVDEATGRVLMSSPYELALSPDGHGGMLAALDKHQCLASAQARGIDHLFYAQVDNPLVEITDPSLIGYHLLTKSQMTTQVVRKRFALEKVGNVVQVDGKTAIIEYSDLPNEVAERTLADGSLALWAGNIAVHLFDLAFLHQVAHSAQGLPFHHARKVVPYLDANGGLVTPAQPNAIKFERFVFDLLDLAKVAMVVEGEASQVFAPVKNADGAPTDTPATAREAICRLHASWLTNAGATIAEGIRVEIDPNWALDQDEVQAKIKPGLRIATDTYFCV